MALNGGVIHREQLGLACRGNTVLGYLSARYPRTAPQEWRARLSRGEVRLGGQMVGGGEGLSSGQILSWAQPPWHEEEVPLHFEVIHQDAALIAVSKPGGLPTLPGGGFSEHTLLHLVRARFGGEPALSPLHRLGRATSGLVLFARTPQAASTLSRAWPQLGKRYLALADGAAKRGEYDIRTPIGPVAHPRLSQVHAASPAGKPSRSVARVLERRHAATLFEVDIYSGRPHQIRIHLASIGHPLVGDPLYAPGGLPRPIDPGLPGDGGYHLHAWTLRFPHPLSGEETELKAPVPPILQPGGGPNTSGA